MLYSELRMSSSSKKPVSSPIHHFIGTNCDKPRPPSESAKTKPVISKYLGSQARRVQSSEFVPPPVVLYSNCMTQMLSILPDVRFWLFSTNRSENTSPFAFAFSPKRSSHQVEISAVDDILCSSFSLCIITLHQVNLT